MIEISKAVIKKNETYLLLKRSAQSASFPNAWDFPGGKHDPGETATQAVIRETKEETLYNITPGSEVKKEKYSDNKYDLLFHYFEPVSVSGVLKLSADHSAYKWVKREDMKNLQLHPSVNLFFE